ncbi:MAG TPA: ATP-dependent DNA helicase RecG [Candidatus Limnocylindria bacterium]|nr:ATP-dependent DNA helicase RecG [Candidatus Limnocylindria bacterium]
MSAKTVRNELLDRPITQLHGMRRDAAPLLERKGVQTIRDLIWNLPRAYHDFADIRPVAELRVNQEQTAEGVLANVRHVRTLRGRSRTEAELVDRTGRLRLVWFGRERSELSNGRRVRVAGRVEIFRGMRQMTQPAVERVGAEAVHTGRIAPIYKLTEGLTEGWMRRWLHTAVIGEKEDGAWRVRPALDSLDDPLPEELRLRYGLPPLVEALREVHFPSDENALAAARRRLAFDELLTLQLGLLLRRRRWTVAAKAPPLSADDRAVAGWLATTGLTPTGAQARALADVRLDLAKTVPMSRLLLGDVGSGKTLVAAVAMRIAAASGHQAVMMAPTELLAEQHLRTLRGYFGDNGPRTLLLSGSLGAGEAREARELIAGGLVDVVVGTHAVIESGVRFANLGLAVVDEQHRFGVRQRSLLREKGTDPHVLLTTATPIPRTLTQTIYRDLDTSYIDELPPGRQTVRTEVRTSDALDRVWPWLLQRLADGEQAFIVCPRIEESEDEEVASAESVYRDLSAGPLREIPLALLHGRIPADTREDVMRRFAAGEVKALVATTVIEVGIDVPNATVMLVLGAERFGLAQLHQLRGRVGRGAKKSFCIVISDKEGSARLDAIARENDGFELAKEDLRLRGAGEFLGARQSGLDELRMVDLADVDPTLLRETSAAADGIVSADADLAHPEHAGIASSVERMWRRYALA